MPNKALLHFCNEYYQSIREENGSLRRGEFFLSNFMKYFDVVILNDSDLRREGLTYLQGVLGVLYSLYDVGTYDDRNKYRKDAKYILRAYMSFSLKSLEEKEIKQKAHSGL